MTATTPSTTSFAPESPPSGLSFASRLRRLSTLRTHHSSAAAANAASHSSSHSQPRSNRYSLTRAVGLALSPHSPVFDHTATETHLSLDLHPTVSTQSAPEPRTIHATSTTTTSTTIQPGVIVPPETSGSGSSSSAEERSDAASHSSRSTPANEPETQSSDAMRFGGHASSTDPCAAAEAGAQPDTSLPAVQFESSLPIASESRPIAASAQRDRSRTAIDSSPSSTDSVKPRGQPTIRLFPHHSQYSRPSLPFTPITRTLPEEECIIKVGRYSERDGIPIANPPKPSDAPVGFKSKVVSRKHCEFSFVNGQWHIKDVGSSSGTFLNHMRLSQPNTPSRSYAVRDGDIIQLGIDFRGGEEMIFRCVRIRIECNRTWQRGPNEFNKNTENLINSLGKGASAEYDGCRECSICLNSVLRPYQCLFMAACAHVWHYKCIRRLIHGPEYPMFQCPNCRAYTDLSADVDDTADGYDDIESRPANSRDQPTIENPCVSAISGNPATEAENAQINVQPPQRNHRPDDLESVHTTQPSCLEIVNADDEEINQEYENSLSPNAELDISRSPNIDIPYRGLARTIDEATQSRLAASHGGSPLVRDNFEDCPLTPRNDLGPLALDGRAGRI